MSENKRRWWYVVVFCMWSCFVARKSFTNVSFFRPKDKIPQSI